MTVNGGSSLTFTGSQLLSLPSLTLAGGSILTLCGMEAIDVDDVIVTGNSVITHSSEGKVYLTCSNMTIDATSSISTDGEGYGPEEGPGRPSCTWGYWGAGAGYGGAGGGRAYGSAIAPVDLGSGGCKGHYSTGRGTGGGAIRLVISDTLIVDGSIAANGTSGGSGGGGGSGGSIYITTSVLAGSGLIAANGGGGWAGGGGGRIAIYYQASSFTGNAEAKGGVSTSGSAGHNGENGTVVIQGTDGRRRTRDGRCVPRLSSLVPRKTDGGRTREDGREATIENITVTGDLSGTLQFTQFEMVSITTGSFANKGFSKGQWQANLEGVDYGGYWHGMFFLKESERRIYLKGAVSGEIAGIVEGYLSEAVAGSGIYDQYDATWRLGRVGSDTVTAAVNLNGAINYQESVPSQAQGGACLERSREVFCRLLLKDQHLGITQVPSARY